MTGQCLNFNCAFVLVLMLRQTLTFLRTRGLGTFLPLDQHIYLHKLTGWLIVCYGVVHTFTHIINFSELTTNPWKFLNLTFLLSHRLLCHLRPSHQCTELLLDGILFYITTRTFWINQRLGQSNRILVDRYYHDHVHLFITFCEEGRQFRSFLLDPFVVYSVLVLGHPSWPKLLEMVHHSRLYIHHRTCLEICLDEVEPWKDLRFIWNFASIQGHSSRYQTSIPFLIQTW